MKKNYFLYAFYYSICAFLFLAASSCSKKDNTDSGTGYYMRFKANGVQKEFKTGDQAAFTTAGNLYSCVLSGFVENSNLNIIIFDHEAITTNTTYTEEILSGTASPKALIGYQDEQNVLYSSGDFSDHPDANARVTLSEITTTSVKGTFTGVVYKDGDKVTIANGEFYLMRAN